VDIDLDGCIKGDPESWHRFCEDTIGLVVAAIRRTCPSHRTPAGEDLDDLVQAVYLKLLKNDRRLLRQYDPSRAKISTWITLISRSVTIDALRKREHPGIELNTELASENPAAFKSASAEVLPTHLLTARQRLILSMLFEDEMDVATVAQALNIHPQTVRSTKHKAMQRLREHFDIDESGDE